MLLVFKFAVAATLTIGVGFYLAFAITQGSLAVLIVMIGVLIAAIDTFAPYISD